MARKRRKRKRRRRKISSQLLASGFIFRSEESF